MYGKPLEGVWYNRSLEGEANRQGKEVAREDVETHYQLKFAPLPCWKHLSPAQIRKRVTALVEQVEEEARVHREESGREVIGMDKVKSQNCFDRSFEGREPIDLIARLRPGRTKKSPIPLVHAASVEAAALFEKAYKTFVEAYDVAALRVKSGLSDVLFPLKSFPTALPFARVGPNLFPWEAEWREPGRA